MRSYAAPLLVFLALLVSSGCGDINVPGDGEICVTGSQRCDGAGPVEQCSADGTKFLFFDECKSSERCDGGVCVPAAGCATGDTRCSDDANGELHCVNGQWSTEAVCWGGLCQGGGCP